MLFLDHPEAALAGLRRELVRAPDPAAMNAFWVALWADHFGDPELALEATAMSYRRSRGTAANPAWLLHRSRRLPAFRTFVREQGFEAYWRATGEWGDFCRPLGDEDFECF